MNNYSRLQQLLHQFALSSKLMREIAFDVENTFLNESHYSDNHVFVSGLARSGTTILLNALFESEEFSSLSYKDMPFVLAPNFWSRFSSKRKDHNFIERAHGDGIKISTESPEAFEEVFWRTFSDKSNNSIKKFQDYVQLINQKYSKTRYLSKNNQNIRRLELISQIFPCSKILIPFRDPVQHSISLLSQHIKFINESKEDIFINKYMKWIGHTEFGPSYQPIKDCALIYENYFDINHWLEQWLRTYEDCLVKFSNKQNFIFICYESLCNDSSIWPSILNKVGIEEIYEFNFIESSKKTITGADKDLEFKCNEIYQSLHRHSLLTA